MIAGRLHTIDESAEELVWFFAELGDNMVGNEGRKYAMEVQEKERACFADLLLWKNGTQYYKSANIDPQVCKHGREESIAAKGEQGCKILRIFKKSIVTAIVKRQILEICGREKNARQLASIHRKFVTEAHPYGGKLRLGAADCLLGTRSSEDIN